MTQDPLGVNNEEFRAFSDSIYSIRTLSTIFIIIFHFGFWNAPWFNNPFTYNPYFFIRTFFDFGDVGVDLFAFLSSMFLSINLLKKKKEKINWTSWIKKRFLRIYPLLWISFIVLIPTLALIGSSSVGSACFDINSILINFSGLGGINRILSVNYLWFITFILTCYLLFPILFSAMKKNYQLISKMIIVLFIIWIVIYYPIFSHDRFSVEIWLSLPRFFSFFFGALFGYWIGNQDMKNLKHFKNKKIGILSFFSLAISFSLYILFQSVSFHYVGDHYYEKFILFPIIAPSIIIFLTYVFMNQPKANKLLTPIGRINYEIYLFHGLSWEIITFVVFALLALPIFLTPIFFIIILISDILVAYPWSYIGKKIASQRKIHEGIIITCISLISYSFLEILLRPFINLSVNNVISMLIFIGILAIFISTNLILKIKMKRKIFEIIN
ncbi:MAG: acyltransferase family protein [Candidatus Helarchaeota archaeon]